MVTTRGQAFTSSILQLPGIPDSGNSWTNCDIFGFLKAQMDFPFQELLQMAFCWADRELSCLLSVTSQNTFRSGRTVTEVFCQFSSRRHQVSISIYPSWQNFMLKKIPANANKQCFNPAGYIWSSSCTSAIVQCVASSFVGLRRVSRTQQGQPQVPFHLPWHPSYQLDTTNMLV